MPKSPPPPRSAQNSSGSDSWVTWTSSPSGFTRSTESTLLAVKPWARVNQLTPPPSSRPTTDGSGLLPQSAIRPVPSSSRISSPHFTPAPTTAVRSSTSTAIAAEGAGAEQEGVVQRGPGGVAGRLRGDGDAGLDRPADGGHDVGGVGDLEDRGGLLVDVDQPRRPGLLPVGVGAGDRRPSTAARRASQSTLPTGRGVRVVVVMRVVLLRWVSGCRAPPSRPALSAALSADLTGRPSSGPSRPQGSRRRPLVPFVLSPRHRRTTRPRERHPDVRPTTRRRTLAGRRRWRGRLAANLSLVAAVLARLAGSSRNGRRHRLPGEPYPERWSGPGARTWSRSTTAGPARQPRRRRGAPPRRGDAARRPARASCPPTSASASGCTANRGCCTLSAA